MRKWEKRQRANDGGQKTDLQIRKSESSTGGQVQKSEKGIAALICFELSALSFFAAPVA